MDIASYWNVFPKNPPFKWRFAIRKVIEQAYLAGI